MYNVACPRFLQHFDNYALGKTGTEPRKTEFFVEVLRFGALYQGWEAVYCRIIANLKA